MTRVRAGRSCCTLGPTAEPVVSTSSALLMLGAAQTLAAAEKASLDLQVVAWSLQEKAKVRWLFRALSCMLYARAAPLLQAGFSSCLGGDGSLPLTDPIARSFLVASSPLLDPRSTVNGRLDGGFVPWH